MKIAIAMAAAAAISGAPALAGPYVIHPARCPDLIEDRIDRRESRRDERVDYSWRDVREDRLDRLESARDRAVTVCPRSAVRHVVYAPRR